MKIANNIKKFRKEKGLTQKELADKIGRSLRMVQKYESGEVEPSIEVLNEIAKELGTHFIDFLNLNQQNFYVSSGVETVELKPKIYLNASLVEEILKTLTIDGIKDNEYLTYILYDDDYEFLSELIKTTLIETVKHISHKNLQGLKSINMFSDSSDIEEKKASK